MMTLTTSEVLNTNLPLVDSIYERLVSEEGLYGAAFFGFSRSKRVSRKLDRLWDKAVRLARQEIGNA